MTRDKIRELLQEVRDKDLDIEAALESLARLPFVDTPSARVDTQRSLRAGIPEVVFGLGKAPEQIVEVVHVLRDGDENVLVTRVSRETSDAVLREVPDGEYVEAAGLLWFGPEEVPVVGKGRVAIICAGTSDIRVAAEALEVARRFGNDVVRLYDVGVAGLHRLLASHEVLRDARVLIVVAGMEGALPSVVGGLVDKPVIAVPTSVGYGAALGGITALFGMLTSCASNVSVVNIDNGFGAAYVATLINRL